MVVVQRPVDETIENELQSLDDEFQEVKSRLSEVRKKGKDTSLAEILSLDFTPKLKMAKATYDRKDVDNLRNLLKEIKEEIDLVDKGSDFEHIYELIQEAYEFLRNEQVREATIVYSKIVDIYKKLPKELQRAVYHACTEIKERISKNDGRK